MTVTTISPETVEYRIVLVDPHARALLAVRTADGYRLPRVSIPEWTRLAYQLRKAIQAMLELDVVILDLFAADAPASPSVVAEVINSGAHSDLKTVVVDDIPPSDLPERERGLVNAILNGNAQSPFCRVGWIDAAIVWVEKESGRALSPRGNFEQYNAGGGFSLVRFRSEGEAAYWLKATGEPNTHELAVTSVLSNLCQGFLPRLIDSNAAWNAWLMAEEATGRDSLPEGPCAVLPLLEDAVQSMAEVQVRTVGHTEKLLEAGAFDQSLATFSSCSAILFPYLEEAMTMQTSTKVPRIEKRRLQELHRIFDSACTRLSNLGLPETVVHGDMNIGNILVGPSHCQFIDWAEAYIGNPLITLQHLLLLNQVESQSERTKINEVLKDRYRSVLSKVCDPSVIDEAYTYMPLVAAYAALYGRGDWITSDLRNAPHRQAYARNIARHMDRAARDPVLLSVLGGSFNREARHAAPPRDSSGNDGRASSEWSRV